MKPRHYGACVVSAMIAESENPSDGTVSAYSK